MNQILLKGYLKPYFKKHGIIPFQGFHCGHYLLSLAPVSKLFRMEGLLSAQYS